MIDGLMVFAIAELVAVLFLAIYVLFEGHVRFNSSDPAEHMPNETSEAQDTVQEPNPTNNVIPFRSRKRNQPHSAPRPDR